MGRVANLELASLWRDRVERQKRSGLSIAEYCQREKISAGSFYAWKRRLRTSRSSVGRKTKPRGQLESARSRASTGGFVQFPLTVKSTIEVHFADGTVLSLPSENLAALALTLKTLHATQLEGATR
jgi:transposase-like protein